MQEGIRELWLETSDHLDWPGGGERVDGYEAVGEEGIVARVRELCALCATVRIV